MNGFFRRLFRKTHTRLVSPDSSSPSETSVSDWPAFLNSYNAELLASPEVQEEAPREAVLQGWLGYPGADEEQIQAVEGRLGITFPPSYRAFLKASNGWRGAGYLQNAVEISTLHDAGVYLLLPDVTFPDGEWEAYHLASWIPGAYRYPSFAHLMRGERQQFHELQKYFADGRSKKQ